ncbi:ferredoxin--NADP(+) reductase [Candidatus Williamhamiltonella defendens]|uniref:Flavodoxin/ferredoxin--NADP reductase n=2 Tax=Candidatus Williamhamiltonella defendens TaxID=138072 RepID=A0A249DXG8_9ENTR|nr:ferredoxin--NADP(+) reductase [Candidatus Hamiltonella defensa]ASV32825.1 ferredoxin--NADP(+) reductase [Candidatus Hamiltonella defensa]ASX26228.1 ferredoxin--NADP(+) reductase [Candidatus Hamiltonella defensa (Bemisia tabaci)]AWK15779.1 ferredoxin--NADP(+) reductase [Candidatus Hamiltonella defensa]MBK4361281.1 ferredoxin--NADP(+) reductase [Candidatus Hamiltonella defensa]CED79283.1 Ferredoxin--NADP reductase [Candidatus Hamiltonella defensa (Bemisia tabaci)]
MAQWVNGKITDIKPWTDSLFSIQIEAPIDPFIAGQYTKLALEIDGTRVQRAYSYVNAPSDHRLEIYLVTVPGGKLSIPLHRLCIGEDIIVASKAQGFFILSEVPVCKTLWMLATGTGIGPYLSILQEGKDVERFERMILVHAVRFASDLSYLPLMKKLEKRYQGRLSIQTVVSREKTSHSLMGRIPELIEKGTLEASVNQKIEAQSSHVMLCGNPQMVKDTFKTLEEHRQMRKHFRKKPGHMSSEQYW